MRIQVSLPLHTKKKRGKKNEKQKEETRLDTSLETRLQLRLESGKIKRKNSVKLRKKTKKKHNNTRDGPLRTITFQKLQCHCLSCFFFVFFLPETR